MFDPAMGEAYRFYIHNNFQLSREFIGLFSFDTRDFFRFKAARIESLLKRLFYHNDVRIHILKKKRANSSPYKKIRWQIDLIISVNSTTLLISVMIAKSVFGLPI